MSDPTDASMDGVQEEYRDMSDPSIETTILAVLDRIEAKLELIYRLGAERLERLEQAGTERLDEIESKLDVLAEGLADD